MEKIYDTTTRALAGIETIHNRIAKIEEFQKLDKERMQIWQNRLKNNRGWRLVTAILMVVVSLEAPHWLNAT